LYDKREHKMAEEKKFRQRKNPQLWQAYLWWEEVMVMRNRHLTRIEHIKADRSNMDVDFEHEIINAMQYDTLLKLASKEMASWGKMVGPVWDWVTGIKGIGDHLAAKVLAQIDYAGDYATISKLWRFSGLAVIEGKAEGKDSTAYNRKLKATLIGEQGVACQFVLHRTFPYRDVYDEYKAEQRKKYPDVMCKNCGCTWDECQHKKTHKRMYNDGHLDMRAKRKIAKLFLSHLWLVWRELEGLPVTKPYVHQVMGHTGMIPPPNWPGDL
jgi:hypothetical protein